jgi:hypothetical protein
LLNPQPAEQVQETHVPDRRAFVARMATIHEGDPHERVERLLGRPDDVRKAPDPVPYPTDEIWCYGGDGHLSLPTLGEVCFRNGRVEWTAGGSGVPPSPAVISETELRSGLRYLYLGAPHGVTNDPLHLIRVANYLQPLGKTRALAVVEEYGRVCDLTVDETWLFLLLRTLFEVPQPPGYMPALHIGALFPPAPNDPLRWPRYPIVIVDDIPFSFLFGVAVGEFPAHIGDHVAYFRAHGRMRANLLTPPDDPFVAYDRLLEHAPGAISSDEGRTFRQVLALVRTAYDPPEAQQIVASEQPKDYARYHREYLATVAHWDARLQIYVRRDGSHGPLGQLAR